MASKRTLITLATIVILLLAVIAGRWGWAKWHVQPLGERYQLGEISRGDVTSRIVANGTLNPVTVVNVGSQVSGTVAELYADYNDPVKKGQMIAQLDPRVYEATVN